MATACRRKEKRGETVSRVGGAPTHWVPRQLLHSRDLSRHHAPPTIVTGSCYFDADAMQRRMDYAPVVTGNPRIAHYVDEHKTFDGIVIPIPTRGACIAVTQTERLTRA